MFYAWFVVEARGGVSASHGTRIAAPMHITHVLGQELLGHSGMHLAFGGGNPRANRVDVGADLACGYLAGI